MLRQYESLLRWSMDLLGVSRSIERKIVAAVTIQFLIVLILGVFGVLHFGEIGLLTQITVGVVIAGGAVAFANTLLITRRDFIDPITAIDERVAAISQGETDVDPVEVHTDDEIAHLSRSFNDTVAYLETVGGQADAIARQDFDDPILDESVPGTLGASLSTMQSNLQEYLEDLEASQEEARRAKQEAEAMASHLQRQATEFGEVMDAAAAGDLTKRLDEDVDNEAMADIARAFNQMLGDLEETILRVQQLGETVDRVSQNVTVGIDEIEQASEEVSRSAEEISAATARQNDQFESVLGEMSDLSATVEEISSTSNEVAETSARAAERSDRGSEAATAALEEMDQIETQVEEITGQIEQLDGEMEKIGEIVEMIDEIAEQTNLLALNASIEAARAGAAGDGFAVVADEVKSLAEETAEATREADELIGGVQSATTSTVEDIREMHQNVEDGVDTVEEALSALDDIVERVREANDGVQAIDDATDEQATTSQQVVVSVEEATDISEETNVEAESAAAAAEEQTATISEVSASVRSLSEEAHELAATLDAFDVESDDETPELTAGAGAEQISGQLEESTTPK